MRGVKTIDRGMRRMAEMMDTAVELVTDAPYWKYLEYGTSRMAPHAFIGPTLEFNGFYRDELVNATRAVIKGQSPRTAVRPVGVKFRNDVKQEILAQGLWDTGNLYRSMKFDVRIMGGF